MSESNAQAESSPTPTPEPERRTWRRRLAIGGGVALGALFLLVALGPTLVSSGPGEALVSSLGAGRVAGSLTIDDLSLGWLSDQEVTGLRIESPDGATRIELDLHLERGLLPLAAGSARIGTLTVTGAARGVRRADGTTSFADLFPVSSAARTEEGPTEPAAAPAQRVGVVLDGVDLRLHDEASGEEVALTDLRGRLGLDLSAASIVDLEGKTRAGGREGSLATAGSVRDLVGPEGRIDPSRARFDLAVALDALPIALIELLGGGPDVVPFAGDALDLDLAARDLTPDGGRATLDVASTGGSSLSATVTGRDGGFALAGEDALTARLGVTEPLRALVLRRVQPVLGDVAAASGGLRIALSDAWIPADGDVGRLAGRLRVEPGRVDLEASSQFVRVLELAQQPGLAAVKAELDPVAVAVADGVATTEPFALRLGRQGGESGQTLLFESEVDLVERRVVRLLGLYPVEGLGAAIDGLEGLPAGARVGLEFSGSLVGADGGPAELAMTPRLDLEPEQLFGDLERLLGDELEGEVPEAAGDAAGEALDRLGDALGGS